MIQGQWIGKVDGDAPGNVILDLDIVQEHFRGAAYLFPNDNQLPSTIAEIPEFCTDSMVLENIQIRPIDYAGKVLDADALAKHFPGTDHALHADLRLTLKGPNELEVVYKTDFSDGNGKLIRGDAELPSKLTPLKTVVDWKSFKDYIGSTSRLRQYDMIYRGQSSCKRLRTSFHRTNRSDLFRYVNEDIPLLQRYLSPATKHYFDLNDPFQNGAFYNLLQHHGYPTPLLDWSYSPYIAAYFAFHSISSDIDSVRIFEFNKAAWQKCFPQFQIVANVRPHFSVTELLGVENDRMIPQQALSTLTNIDDIETYISDREADLSQTFLTAIELPIDERDLALFELNMMGINEATLFPGIESSCKFLRARNFAWPPPVISEKAKPHASSRMRCSM